MSPFDRNSPALGASGVSSLDVITGSGSGAEFGAGTGSEAQTEPKMEDTSICRPASLGVEACLYLAKHSWRAVSPPIRSSDYDLLVSNPFVYLLRVRYGLKPWFESSPALRAGTWFHECLEHWIRDKASLDARVAAYIAQIRRSEADGVISSTIADNAVEAAEREALAAMTWFRVASTLKMGDLGSLDDFLTRYQVLGRELRLKVRMSDLPGAHRRGRKTWALVRLDMLLYDPRDRVLWAFDAKTEGRSASMRCMACSVEFQTKLYCAVLQAALQTGLLASMGVSVPPDTQIGGMIHWVVQKCLLRMSLEDRNFKVERNGSGIERKTYFGPPVYENYLKRVESWYSATDQYAHLAIERENDPVVNMSFTPMKSLDLERDMWFTCQLEALRRASTRAPAPGYFPPNVHDLRERHKAYLPFVLQPVELWPSVAIEEGFIVEHRVD